MNLRPMKPLESRLAAIGLLVLVIALAYFLLLHWWFVAPLRDSRLDRLPPTSNSWERLLCHLNDMIAPTARGRKRRNGAGAQIRNGRMVRQPRPGCNMPSRDR